MTQLRDWLRKQGLTQQSPAVSLGLTNSAMTKSEKGPQRLRPELAKRIEAFIRGEVTAASLLGLSEPKPRKSGLSEDAATFNDASRLTVDVALPSEPAKALKDDGIDVEAVARAGSEKALKEAKAWAEANREAIEASNAWIEKHGTFAEQLGLI